MNTLLLDDRLEVRADKTFTDGSGRKLNLSEDWKDKTIYSRNDTGQVNIYSYWNKSGAAAVQYISPEKYIELPEADRALYIPCFEREVKTNIPNTFIRARDNSFYIRLCGLSTSDEGRLLSSRYRTVLDVLHSIRPEIIDYKNRGGSEKAFLESSRNIIKRNFNLYEYEYNILILNKELGKKVFEELSGACQNRYLNTLYIKGYDAKGKKQGGTSVKIYDHGLKHTGEHDLYKLEITFRAAVFRKLDLNIADMTLQEVCINRLKAEAMTEMLKLKGGEAVEMLQGELFREENILARFIRLERKSAEHDRDIADIKQQLEELKKQR
jgi:hypothetical protein